MRSLKKRGPHVLDDLMTSYFSLHLFRYIQRTFFLSVPSPIGLYRASITEPYGPYRLLTIVIPDSDVTWSERLAGSPR